MSDIVKQIEELRAKQAAIAALCHDETLIDDCGLGCWALLGGRCEQETMKARLVEEEKQAKVDARESPRCRVCGTILERSPECRLCGTADLEPLTWDEVF